MMKKIALTILGIVLLGGIFAALWLVNEREREVDVPKESFIPDHSAIVIHVNANAKLSPEIDSAFSREIKTFRRKLLSRVVDTLKQADFVDSGAFVVAIQVEKEQILDYLYVLNRSGMFSRGDVHLFLSKVFSGVDVKERKYDDWKIYAVTKGEEKVCYVIVGGVMLVSNSEAYVEDALKQLKLESGDGKEEMPPRYENVNRYFSMGADFNVFLNTGYFSEILPLFLQKDFIAEQTDISQWFKWGALDGEVKVEGISFNGFLHPDGLKASFPAILKGQIPQDSPLDGVLPPDLKSVSLFVLSDVSAYLTALESYRDSAGIMEAVRNRKQEFTRLFGDDLEKEWRELLKGEWGKGSYSYDPQKKTEDGIVVVHVKAGSLAKVLLENMLGVYAQNKNVTVGALQRSFSLDKDKTVSYFKMPVPDFAGVMWGSVLDGIATNYVLVEDNYVVFASSESAMQAFAKDYMRHLSVKDQEWYRKLRAKLSAKYNWMYLSEMQTMLPYYSDVTRGGLHDALERNRENMNVFSSFGLQWVSEGDMLYHTLYLSTEEVEQQQAQVMWQTKLDAKVAIKPVIVKNHNTGEREVFVQDEGNKVYLINDEGRILWELPVDGRINSDVYQVDMFKNGKLQYLFSTPTSLYLIDRNGNYLPRYPLAFKSSCESGITLCDYDNDKEYRIFAPGVDRYLYLYELSGDFVKGWVNPKSDNAIVSKVYHFRVDQKDYIVYADCCRLYIMDRRGGERVKISTLLNLSSQTPLYLMKRGAMSQIVFVDAEGEIWLADFNGEIRRLKEMRVPVGGMLNVVDLNNDGKGEFVYACGDTLRVYNAEGGLLAEQHGDDAEFGFPYAYHFSTANVKIGILDSRGERLFLGGISDFVKGFPIRGNSPFAIAFFDKEDTGFYLFAGGEGTHLLKYRIQQ